MTLKKPGRLILILALAVHSAAQTREDQSVQPPDDLSQWDLICYCITSVSTPHFAVRADTNGRILYYAQTGATKSQIEHAMAAPVLSSQLELLRDWRLLQRNGDIYTTNIPVLGPKQIGRLRERMGSLAIKIAAENRNEVQKIALELGRRRLSDRLYAVMFSYVLDGLTWDRLQSREAIPRMKITAGHPFWDGTFWALYPKRKDAPGTNTVDGDGITLRMTWTDPVLKQVNALLDAPALTSAMQKAAKSNCQHLSVEDKARNKWDFGLPGGWCAFPVIQESGSDPIHAASMKIADRIAKAVLDQDMQDLVNGGATVQQAHLIETHELLWEVLDAFERQDLVHQPPVLRTGSATTSTLLPLLVLTVRRN